MQRYLHVHSAIQCSMTTALHKTLHIIYIVVILNYYEYVVLAYILNISMYYIITLICMYILSDIIVLTILLSTLLSLPFKLSAKRINSNRVLLGNPVKV